MMTSGHLWLGKKKTTTTSRELSASLSIYKNKTNKNKRNNPPTFQQKLCNINPEAKYKIQSEKIVKFELTKCKNLKTTTTTIISKSNNNNININNKNMSNNKTKRNRHR
jgi:hypothetical protein